MASGLDTIDFAHYGPGITVNLGDPNQNSGNAAGDTFTNFNSVIGTNYNDTLIGDASINALEGRRRPHDTLSAAADSILRPMVTPPTGVMADLADPAQNTGDAQGDTYSVSRPDRFKPRRHLDRRRQ